MTAARDRKQAARILGIALQVQYRALLEAVGNDAVQDAAIKLGGTFNANIEAIIWFLKEYGGVQQMPLEPQHRAANDEPKAAMLPDVDRPGHRMRPDGTTFKGGN